MLPGLAVVLFSLIGTCVYSASLEAEKTSETVTLKIYQYSVEKWAEHSKTSSLQSRLATDANTYCEASPSSCGLLYWDPAAVFSPSDVGVTTIKKDKNMEVTVYVTFPANANVSSVSPTTFVLNKAATYNVVTANKAAIETAIGLQVTYIDKTYYGIKMAVEENEIIIPIAFALVIALVIVVVAMHYWQKRRTKKVRSIRKKENRPITTKVSPEKTSQTYNENWNQENTHQMRHVNSSPTRVTEPVVVSSLNEFTDTTPQAGYPLPAIEDVKKERKKKKKMKKKHRREHHDRESESENTIPSYNDTMFHTQQTTLDV